MYYLLVSLASIGVVLYILIDLEKMSKKKGWGKGWIGWKRLTIVILLLIPIVIMTVIIELITKWFIGNELLFPVIATVIAVIWWIWLKTKYRD